MGFGGRIIYMNQEKIKKLILIIGCITVVILVIFIVLKTFIFNTPPLLEYKNSNNQILSQSLICVEINNQELKNYCLNNIKVDFNLLEEEQQIRISESNFNAV